MSDTGTFDAAINHLTNRLNSRGEGSEREELRQSIRVLEDWPVWKPLIEAAGKLNSGDRTWLRWVVTEGISSSERGRKDRFRALLEALPEKEKP